MTFRFSQEMVAQMPVPPERDWKEKFQRRPRGQDGRWVATGPWIVRGEALEGDGMCEELNHYVMMLSASSGPRVRIVGQEGMVFAGGTGGGGEPIARVFARADGQHCRVREDLCKTILDVLPPDAGLTISQGREARWSPLFVCDEDGAIVAVVGTQLHGKALERKQDVDSDPEPLLTEESAE